MNVKGVIHRFWTYAGGASIRTKIFGIVLGSTLLLSLGFAWQFRAVQVKELEHKTKDQGISIARDVAARATDLILINDLYALHQLLSETQANYHDIRYIFITNPDGEVLAHTFGDGFPKDLNSANQVRPDTFQHTEIFHTDEGIVWDVAVPVFDGQAGVARVGISDASLRQTIGRLTTQLFLTILGVLAGSLLAATFLTWLLTRPILRLVAATEAVSRGDFSQRVPRWANDEIGSLAVAFNQMSEELGRTESFRREQSRLRRQLLEGVISAQEEERRRIARELHDSTTQSLTSVMVGLHNLEVVCDKPELHTQLTGIRQVVSQTLDEVHALAWQLRPSALDDLGLEAALESFVQEWADQNSIATDMVINLGEQRLPESLETAIYRIVQEALTNVSRHAQASSVSLLISQRGGEITTIIEDDGRGFDLARAMKNGRLGLLGIQERAELLGGSLKIESRPQEGVSLYVYLPVSSQAENIRGVHA